MTENAAKFESDEDDVFGRIASRYDLLCDLFSFGIHRLWKRRVASIIAGESWETLLDTASGTGDIAIRVFDQLALFDNKKIIVSDLSPKMLAIANKRISKKFNNVEIAIINACSMPEIKSHSIDVFSMSLGLKICDRELALQEAYRVLKPSGKLVLLEASNIPVKSMHKFYLWYMYLVMPIIGWIATKGDTSAYKYLLKGIESFPTAEKLAEEIKLVGFERVSFQRLTFGIVAIHIATKSVNC